MNRAEKRGLVFQLRREVRDVKNWFLRFAFQGAALTVVVAWFILGASNRAAVAWTAIPTIYILMLVCRVGLFLYTTANRNLGYELHLDRLRKHAVIGDDAARARIAKLEEMGWEEALRAWRVVHASIFATLYRVPEIRSDRILPWPFHHIAPWLYKLRKNPKDRENDPRGLEDSAERYVKGYKEYTEQFRQDLKYKYERPYAWWNQKKLTELGDHNVGSSRLHTGNFLKDMFSGLTIMQWILFSLFCWAENSAIGNLRELPHGTFWYWVSITGLCTIGLIILLRKRRLDRRRLILEEELVSIHSCAITWTAVAIVHFAAAENTKWPYYNYTVRLAELCHFIEATKLPTMIGDHICEGQSFFRRDAYREGLLIDRRCKQRRAWAPPQLGNDRRKQVMRQRERRQSDRPISWPDRRQTRSRMTERRVSVVPYLGVERRHQDRRQVVLMNSSQRS